jgi:hypothetical protein
MSVETVEQFLARGGKIQYLPPQKVKKSLSLSWKMGFKQSSYNVGLSKKWARELANLNAA